MKHLGDITKISGRDAPTVNVIIGGSPCQDLSVAGKRAGLSGERSGLFMEQIRVIKEMREKDAESGRTGTDIRPRFMVWENVPGAFSVNGGRDFAAVLEETAKVADKEIPDIPVPADGWSNSGCIMGRGFSIAWRVLDAQFFGVPQRRRRIALVADFAGGAAPEILFERESVSGHSEPCEAERKGTAGNAADSTGTASGVQCLNPHDSQSARVYDANGVWHSLNANSNGGQSRDAVCYPINTMLATRGKALGRGTGFGVGNDGEAQFTLSTAHEHAVCYGICSDKSNSMLSGNPHSGIYEADTSRTLDNNCGNPACNQGGIAVVEHASGFKGGQSDGGIGYQEETAPTLSALPSALEPTVVYPEVSRTLSARHDSSPCIDRGQEFICYESSE